jgi:hypothetical protein
MFALSAVMNCCFVYQSIFIKKCVYDEKWSDYREKREMIITYAKHAVVEVASSHFF